MADFGDPGAPVSLTDAAIPLLRSSHNRNVSCESRSLKVFVKMSDREEHAAEDGGVGGNWVE